MNGPITDAATGDGVRGTLDQAGSLVDGICRLAEAALPVLPAAAAGVLRADVAELRSAFAGLTRDLDAMLAAAGDTDVLRSTAAQWVDGVSAPVSRLVGLAGDDVLETDDHWTGRAADAYRATLPAQRAALGAVLAICHDVDTNLNDLAAAITTFWITVGAACTTMVFGLAGALTAGSTGIGVAVAVGCVGVVLAAANTALDQLTVLRNAAAAQHATLGRRLADDTAFPLGAWPRSAAGIGTEAGDWAPR